MNREEELERWFKKNEEELSKKKCGCEDEKEEAEDWSPGENIHKLVNIVEKRVITPEAAALLLFAVFIFGIISSFYVLGLPQPSSLRQDPIPGPTTGYVWTPDGDPLQGVSMRLHGLDYYASTDERGFFHIHEAPPGEYDLSASADGYNSVVYRVTVDGKNPTTHHFTMNPGSSSEYYDRTGPQPPPSLFSMRMFLALMFMFGALCALASSILAFRRRKFKTCLALAGLGILSYGFMVGALVSAIATGFIMAEKHCFDCKNRGASGEIGKTGSLICKSCGSRVLDEEYLECSCGEVYHYECALRSSCVKCNQEFEKI